MRLMRLVGYLLLIALTFAPAFMRDIRKVTFVARHGQVVSLEAVGYQDLENCKLMRTDIANRYC